MRFYAKNNLEIKTEENTILSPFNFVKEEIDLSQITTIRFLLLKSELYIICL